MYKCRYVCVYIYIYIYACVYILTARKSLPRRSRAPVLIGPCAVKVQRLDGIWRIRRGMGARDNCRTKRFSEAHQSCQRMPNWFTL